ncbi:MAG: glycosyltransferase family 2 protein, partial [Burkholderiales bacterium]
MSEPDISVVVRSMARPTLARTLASIAAQEGVTLEAIVVATCGAAHAPPPASAGRHPLRFVGGNAARPRAVAANAGLDAAHGRYVTWLDDDDEWLPGHLRGLLDAAGANPAAGVVHSLADVRVDGAPPRAFGQPMARSELLLRSYIHPSSALVDRRLVQEGCRCDEALPVHEDDLAEFGGDRGLCIKAMIEKVVDRMYAEIDDNRFLEVTYANGDKEVMY